ncbi:phage GP46 family protein [Pandoraea sp. SD6-2]|uniref:phage GP46 family protein n=1 Tax=Pandoraea sp. SD6-2 TaxID=1286093 RepID=UPI00032F8A5E|nr:phage GP46 family protein [Pandoraea sp. SD6-2]EON13094.1 phage GP46 family protein [Pandoraea sp. SD6-2]
MDALLNPRTGGYAGSQTDSLANAIYIRLETPLGSWWAAPNVGSLLHTLAREKDTPRVRRLVEQYAEQALAPIVKDGRATKIILKADACNPGWVLLHIDVHQAAGKSQYFQYQVKVS